jgi:hypothetical protein
VRSSGNVTVRRLGASMPSKKRSLVLKIARRFQIDPLCSNAVHSQSFFPTQPIMEDIIKICGWEGCTLIWQQLGEQTGLEDVSIGTIYEDANTHG